MAKRLASMTGFGRASGALSPRLLASVVVRTVNHRYLDVQVRTNLREELPEVEAVARRAVSAQLERGRVSVQVVFDRAQPATARVMIDPAAVSAALAQLRAIDPDGRVGVGDVLAVPGMVTVTGSELVLDDDETSALSALFDRALAALTEMRLTEARHLATQISSELAVIADFAAWFEPQMGDIKERLFARTRERLAELLGDAAAVSEERLVQEAAVAADRTDVAEEVVRLKAHLATLETRMREGGAVGRALDFLCQEVHRELNTLGSKCRELGVAERLVDAKTAVERIREQVQNLE